MATGRSANPANVVFRTVQAMRGVGWSHIKMVRDSSAPSKATYLGHDHLGPAVTNPAIDAALADDEDRRASTQEFVVVVSPDADRLLAKVGPAWFDEAGEAPVSGLWIGWTADGTAEVCAGRGKGKINVGHLTPHDAAALAVEAVFAKHGQTPILAYGFIRPSPTGAVVRIMIPSYAR